MDKKHQNSGLVIKNGVYLFFRLLLVLFLGFFATRLSLQVLGDEKFGIYNIVGGIIAIFAIISMPIRDTIQRFLNVEFAKEQILPGTVFKTAQGLTVAMIILISILYESVGLYLINYVIQYPIAEKVAVNIIFQISVLTNVFGFASLPFVSLLFSRENMGIPAICEIVGSIVKVVLIYCIQFVPINVLIPYATVFLAINVLPYCFYQIYCRKVYPECFEGKNIDLSLRRNMLSFSGWSFLEAVSGIALTYVPNVFINIFGGVLYNTAYGISKQLQNAVVSFSSNVLKASDPQIISNTVTSNLQYRDRLVNTTAKISLIIVSFSWLVFHFEGPIILKIWLGHIPKYTFEFCEIAILSVVFSSVSLPFRSVIMATGKIKYYFSFFAIISLLSMCLMFYLLMTGSLIITVMWVILIVEVVRLIISIGFSTKYAKLSFKNTLIDLGKAMFVIIVSYCIYYLFKQICCNNILYILLPLFLSFGVLLTLSFFICLSKEEQKRSFNLINNIINKIKQ